MQGMERKTILGHPDAPCPDCGGDCAPECGRHPMGCVFGGFTEVSAYWLVTEGCPRKHGGEEQ